MTNTQQLLVELQEMFRNVEYQDGIGRCLTQDLEAVEVAYDKVRREINSTLGSGTGAGSRTGHTAGPWHVAPGLETVRDSNEYQVCYVESDYHTIDESDANARLIAAAPELLDALKDVRDQVFRTDEHERLGMTIGAWEHVLAAIAKAEGRERGDNDNSGSAT